MKRCFLVLVASLAFVSLSSPSFSQVQALGIGGSFILPTGDLSNSAGAGFGGTVRLFYHFEDLKNIVVTGTVGYMRFGSKDASFFGLSNFEYRWTLIPIMTGGRYYLTKEEDAPSKLYVGGELGYHIYSLSVTTPTGSGSITGGLSSSNEFALQPMFGIELGSIDVYAQYTIASFNYFGVNVNYKFDLKK